VVRVILVSDWTIFPDQFAYVKVFIYVHVFRVFRVNPSADGRHVVKYVVFRFEDETKVAVFEMLRDPGGCHHELPSVLVLAVFKVTLKYVGMLEAFVLHLVRILVRSSDDKNVCPSKQ